MTATILASRLIDGHSYQIDTDPNRLDIALIHDFLARDSYWARGIGHDILRRAIANSLVFGLYRGEAQIGFARAVTDRATFAYLADVFVLPGRRNAGLGQWLIETILADPRMQGLRRWLLVTSRAESLYRRCGFADLRAGLRYLERFDAGAYGPVIETPDIEKAASA